MGDSNKDFERLAEVLDSVAEEMKQEGWVPNNPDFTGAYGAEVHRRSTPLLNNHDRFLADVYVRTDTREILSIAQPPPGGTANTTQLDLLYLADDYRPGVGDVLDPDQLDGYVDIKTNKDGRIDTVQRGRIRHIVGSEVEIYSAAPELQWHHQKGWHVPSKRKKLKRLLGLVGGALVVHSIVRPSQHEWQLDEALSLFDDAAGEQLNGADKRAATILGILQFREYLANFMLDETALNVLTLERVISVLDNDWY
ncbi:MAG: hypothetical protein ACR2GY_06605 [Phycisphaerales bacterium]